MRKERCKHVVVVDVVVVVVVALKLQKSIFEFFSTPLGSKTT